MPGTNAYNEPAQAATYEEKIKRSVFIANVSACHDDGEAKAFIALTASKYRDATHNCRAYVLHDGTEYSSDDGEPSGTAGKPILGAIRRSGLVNVAVVVTRYYGGVKLGVRGLIEAYGGVAMKALELCGSIERVMTSTFCVSMGYNSVGNVARLIDSAGAVNVSWSYAENVSVKCDIPAVMREYFSRELEEMKAREIVAEYEED
ncbi:MAG: YigZ family protein [Synergistaceae bacterium]|nr:YigZ family protein [Synergistaceae bacterium]